ncbi:hypothetical protein ACUY3M_06885 [Corynebacterium suicordis]|uniref:Uncharacterized protein n=1 Tax=Corynebacterium suicordis DSM 45110 TaxID=1121369 RepID=A0ABR9ZK22_9CORY|nr:hypothetical protein [Corynebacterium suicordis]MBF4553740.1 hypothetical protein [Corynebacterium suicordis DSM 45110]MDR6277283.1 hypothetical protein [Corynebacterium suicordis]
MANQTLQAAEQIYVPTGLFGQTGVVDLTHPFSELWPFFQTAVFPVLAFTIQSVTNFFEGTVRFLPNEILSTLFA